MHISVVIPVYNRPDLLGRALQSVARQSLSPIEIVVVDDGSSPPLDENQSRIYPKINVVRNEYNSGVAAARNLGIKCASGHWIALLDSDDEWEPSKLEKQSDYLQRFPHIRAIHTDEKWLRNNNEVKPPAYLDKSSYLIWERSLKHCLVCPSSVLLHRSIFDTIGFFDESLTVCEDYDFWLRLLLHKPIGLVDEKLVIKHGGHADQLSTTTWGMDRFRIIALEKLLLHPLLAAHRKHLIYQVIIEKCTILAHGSEKRQKKNDAERYRNMAEKYSGLLNKKIT